MLPMPNAASPVKAAKIAPSHGRPMPLANTYIAPPRITPRPCRARGNAAPRNLRELRRHAQQPGDQQPEQRPGPPTLIAVDTPAMLPTPTVEASAVAKAWNGVTEPSVGAVLSNFPNTVRNAKASFVICMPPVAIVSTTPAPISRIIIGGPQTRALSVS
jgi:hypothetical protein